MFVCTVYNRLICKNIASRGDRVWRLAMQKVVKNLIAYLPNNAKLYKFRSQRHVLVQLIYNPYTMFRLKGLSTCRYDPHLTLSIISFYRDRFLYLFKALL